MVPHDARHSIDDLDIFSLNDLQDQDPLLLKDETTTSSGLFGDDLEIKPEIDTGSVSESCFSFKKLWKYMGPGWLM
jgi:natural resistance-associated macrophage protein